MRKVHIVYSNKSHVVKVFYNPEFEEYVCKLYRAGKHYEPADYFTPDKVDAIATAERMSIEEARLS